MPVITLPDGTEKTFENSVSIMDVALSIGEGLARATVAGKVDGELFDASHMIESDATVHLITAKSDEGVEVIRHSTAHLLAQAVQQLFPKAQVTIGPTIEDGFYYDFAYPDGFTLEDLSKIEKCMKELASAKTPIERIEMPRNEAIKHFKAAGEHYKAEIIESIPEDQTISLYRQGTFTDLCRGPHVPHTGYLKVFKLMKVAGAYWRGDSNNEMLQRIYGTAWASKDDQKSYLFRLEEAAKRDHRKIGKAQDLFHLQEDAPGMVFWHDKGWTIYQTIEQYIRKQQRASGYQEIKTPIMADISLWEKSGHADKYSDGMFLTESENRTYAIKPMNCPCHVQVFKHGLTSYKDLPVRLAEFGCCHRNEPSGALHGLMRARGFTQDDGHIFCMEDQIECEVAKFMGEAFEIYKHFGFTEIEIKLALRPDNRIGEDAAWDKAEQALASALKSKNIEFEILPGEGAFYGPKIELHLKDSLGRRWQCGTMQVDFFMPGRLGAHYIDEHSTKQVPVMLHRATLGSMERFIGMLIESTAGRLPLWLAPVQVVVMGVSERHNEYTQDIETKLKKIGIRAKSDLRNEKIGYKIRELTLERVPYMVILGDQEVENKTISVRTLSGEDLGSLSLDAFNDHINEQLGE